MVCSRTRSVRIEGRRHWSLGISHWGNGKGKEKRKRQSLVRNTTLPIAKSQQLTAFSLFRIILQLTHVVHPKVHEGIACVDDGAVVHADDVSGLV